MSVRVFSLQNLSYSHVIMDLFSFGNMDDIDSGVCVRYYINDICVSFLFYTACGFSNRPP